MCGIAGIYHSRDSVSVEAIQRMTHALVHRGPDDGAVLKMSDAVAFGHRRLSIIDLSSSGRQPMQTQDRQFTLTYNGEIYNYQELRLELTAKGYQFNTQTDTEVVLIAFVEWGVEAFQKLNGMFALALWDNQLKTLYLARDRFGVKPLYYFQDSDLFIFASEVKALKQHPKFNMGINAQALSEYLWYGAALGESSLFDGVKKVSPGSFLKITNESLSTHYYWKIGSQPQLNIHQNEAISQNKCLLESAIQRHCRSDVPIAIFLSGGIDSSGITAFASRHYAGELNTYAVGFDYDKGVNELAKAAFVAKHFKTNHHELHIQGAHLPDTISQLVEAHDEPFADAADIPLYLLCQELKGQVKVVLQGDGGDEIYAGYRRYNVMQYEKLWHRLAVLTLPLINRMPHHPIVKRYQRFLLAMHASTNAQRMALLLTVDSALAHPYQVLSAHYQDVIKTCDPIERYRYCAEQFKQFEPVQRMLYTDASILLPDIFLEKVDKPTMANSIEVRVPFLDAELTEFVTRLPARYKVKKGQKKWLLRQSLRGIVPDQILDAPKTGFGVPFGYWLRTSLSQWMKSILLDSSCDLMNQSYLERLIKNHIQGTHDYSFILWKSLLLALWYQKNMLQYKQEKDATAITVL